MKKFTKRNYLDGNKMRKLQNELAQLNNLGGQILQAIDHIANPKRKGVGWFPRALSRGYKLVKSLGYDITYGRNKQYANDLVNVYLNQAWYDNSLNIEQKKAQIYEAGLVDKKLTRQSKRQGKAYVNVLADLIKTSKPRLSLSKIGQKSAMKEGVLSQEFAIKGVPSNFKGSKAEWNPDKEIIDDPLYVNDIIQLIMEEIDNTRGDLIRVVFDVTNQQTGESSAVATKLVARSEIAANLQAVLSSERYYQFSFKDARVSITSQNIIKGGSSTELDEYLKGRKGFYQIVNEDDLCGQRCLAIAMYSSKQFSNYRAGKCTLKKNLSKVLEYLPNRKLAFTDFEDYKEKQVVIVGKNGDILYRTKVESEEKSFIYYDFDHEHYHLVTNMNTFTRTAGCQRTTCWCDKCERRIKWVDFRGHKCKPSICQSCKCEFASEEAMIKEHFFPARRENGGDFVRCPDCNMGCHGADCLKNHIRNVCPNQKENKGKHRWKCPCGEWYTKGEYHKCGEVQCNNCEKYFPNQQALDNHRCFIKKPNEKQLKAWCKPCKWLVYDFESTIDPVTNHHEVNLAMVANSEGKVVFSCKTLSEFVDYCLTLKNTTMIAHNGKAYDTWLVHQHLIKKTGQRPSKLILAGQKIMSMKIKSTTFIDSINHVAGSLEGLPKTLGFDTEGLKKGFFPYTFNTRENETYVGPMPDIKHFDMGRMMPSNRDEFVKWYNDLVKVGYVWDHHKELHEYCTSDVVILARAMKIYQERGIESSDGIDPLNCVTIASYCMNVFKANHMGDQTIAILKKAEYDFCKRGFFGGRTNAVSLYKDWTKTVDKGVYGRYIDVQSLYPSVQFYDELPIGAPRWVEEPTCVDKIGYYEVDITPPNDLYHPVLPERRDHKLMFDLLPKTKAVYSSVELNKAIGKGYVITRFHRAFVWDNSSRDLFKSYVAKNLLQKVQATGFKGTDEELCLFIKEHKTRFDIDIDPAKLVKNPGMRALAKIQLNSLWGKFGQSVDMTTNKYITRIDTWQRMLKDHLDGKIELKKEVIIDDDCLYSEYVELQEERTCLDTTNVGLAGFVTAQARLRLYKELDKLGNRVCYFDTDSIIYETSPNGYNTVEGNYLGEWESETGGMPITKFCSIGPKSYTYQTEDGNYYTKFKGFTLNYENSSKITFDTLKSMIDEGHHIKTRVLEFNKNKRTGVITTQMNDKTASFVYNKRCIVNKYETLPFGHKDIK